MHLLYRRAVISKGAYLNPAPFSSVVSPFKNSIKEEIVAAGIGIYTVIQYLNTGLSGIYDLFKTLGHCTY